MHKQRSSVVFVWVCLLASCWAQRAEQLLAQNSCSSKTICSDCIRTAFCAWCFAPEFNGPRCFNPAVEGGTGGCDEAYIFNPDNQRTLDPMFNKELTRARGRIGAGMESSFYEESYSSSSTSMKGGSGYMAGGGAAFGENLVQIKPQRVNMKLRMTQDYPVDLYYLMDLSRSMKNDKDKLSTLGSLLSSTMRNITSNFRIGFGSFVDKLVMPYVSTVPKKFDSQIKENVYKSNHKYREMKKIAERDVPRNLDSPEGGFDAIMQAIVCQQEIGWREKARRLLVFSTDAGFHYAGDGKLGGIVQPNDGECHMENNSYTHSTIQDYPSISQINLKVKEHGINVIFAVTSEQFKVYEQLSKNIQGSSSGVLSEDSDNVVELVREQYNVGDVVEFTAEITLKECPKDPSKWKETFTIYPVGMSESLTVELEMLCDCPCEHPGHHAYSESPLVCSGQGISACGVCLCNPGRFGKGCECSAHGGASLEQERGCRPGNASTGPLCSGRGSCNCGLCECNKLDDPLKVISGPFCECDNFTCDMNKGELCSGREHGECVCGKCACKPDYTGPACQCPLDETPCLAPNGKSCSGHGHCVCGQCVCDVDEDRHYTGIYCEKSPALPRKCLDFQECVLCQVHKRGRLYNPDEPKECGKCDLEPVIEEGRIEANQSLNENLCNYYDDDHCLYVYVYSYNETEHLHIRAQKEKVCPKKVSILGIVLGVIAAIVLVGLALLMLWKMVTTIHDRREFARFEKERMMAKWDTGENPIYKQATSTFKNPTYAGK
ncbi:Integrin beta-PS [Papilio xuthus]|uniref:Integrin beta n=1 Tax=Papilio xuthus TaxID=66420 RepID=A0A194PEH3_PAPXU|nr:Integrin beta-PS [Papilio xuthus]